MKSYLTGNPEIRVALNEDLSIGGNDYRSSGAVLLDDCYFHESVCLDNFDIDRTLTLVPPDGEFPVMNYRMTQPFKPPFRINALIEEAGSLKAEVIIKVRAEFLPSVNANSVLIEMPLPTSTARVNFELEPGAVGTTDFKEANKRLEWGIKKIGGGTEHTLRAKLTFSQEIHGNIMKEAGPISMSFTIPMYNASRLQLLDHPPRRIANARFECYVSHLLVLEGKARKGQKRRPTLMRVYDVGCWMLDVGCWLYDRDIISTYPTVLGEEKFPIT